MCSAKNRSHRLVALHGAQYIRIGDSNIAAGCVPAGSDGGTSIVRHQLVSPIMIASRQAVIVYTR